MSFANPGKRGLLTVIALMLIVGVPGIVAYADDSTVTYYNLVESDVMPDYIRIYDNTANSTYTFGVTTTQSEEGVDFLVDDVSTDTTTQFSSVNPSLIYIASSTGSISEMFSKITFATDLSLTSVKITFFDASSNTLGIYSLVKPDGQDYWSYDFSALEILSLEQASKFTFTLGGCDSLSSTFYTDMKYYTSDTVFTDDVVELIVMLGGIALLICGTFALSFIDVDTPGKAVSYAKRGIRSAGNKLRRGKK